MRVRVTVTLDIDAEAWSSIYGTDTAPTAVRRDVQEWAFHHLTQAVKDAQS